MTIDLRYEKKFLIHKSFEETKSILQLLPLALREEFPTRQVHNIYFDDLNFSNIFDNLAGVGERKKIRLRWYTPQEKTAYLEIKCKTGLLGSKSRFVVGDHVTSIILKNYFEYNSFLQHCDYQVRSLLSSLAPVLRIHYQRHYWASTLDNIRLTIDHHLACSNIMFRPYDEFDKISTETANEFCVMEVKYPQGLETQGADFLQSIPFFQSKFSKYIHGFLQYY